MRSGGHRGAGQGLAGLSAAEPCWVVGIRVVGQKVALRILHWREVPPLLARAGKRGEWQREQDTVNRVTGKGNRSLAASSVNRQGSSLNVNGARGQGTC